MKSKHLLLFMLTCISLTNALAQPVIGLQRTIGGSGDDIFTCMSLTKDSGLIIGGSSNSNKSGNKSENSKGTYDFWILLLNNKGAIPVQKTIGGNSTDELSAVEQITDGGYILGGYSSSNISGDKTQNSRGSSDYWIVKLDSTLNIQWDKTIGGTYQDQLYSIKQTSDGGYIAGGYSESNISGEKTENARGFYDYWIVKLDANGNIEWDKTIGGDYTDELFDIIQTNDDGYLVGGYSGSPISGEKTQSSRGLDDYWIVKLDNAGNIQWDKTYGGTDYDRLSAMVQSPDGGYLLGGNSASDKSGEKMQNSRGRNDYWIVKTDNLGQVEWSNTYGGRSHDDLSSIEPTSDDGYMLVGNSASDIYGEKTENSRGIYDYWIIKLSRNGTIQWDKTIGGSQTDLGTKIKEIGRNRYIVAGASYSGIGGDKTENNKGTSTTYDYWLVELRYSKPDSIAVAALPNNLQVNTGKSNISFTVYPNPAKYILHIQNAGKATVTLTDQQGKTIFTKTINGNGVINVSQLPAGLYYVKNNETGEVQKIMITK